MLLLDITLSLNWIIVIVIGLILLFISLLSTIDTLKKQRDKQGNDSKLKEVEQNSKIELLGLTIEKMKSDAKGVAQEIAQGWFEEWKKTELIEYKKIIDKNALDAATNSLNEWIAVNERRIRDDAAKRSAAVNFGKVAEHFVPFHSNFAFNPQDARFIGSPIDLILFDGATDSKDEITIYFIEVKTGNSKLVELQRKIKSAVANKRIEWLLLNPETM